MRSSAGYDLLMRVPLAAAMLHAGLTTGRGILSFCASSPGKRGMLFYSGLSAQVAVLAYVVVVVALTFARLRPRRKLPGLVPRATALGASCLLPAVLGFLPKLRPAPGLELLGAALIAAGMAIAGYALAWLGRSFSVMPEARRLVTSGPYRRVRHPVYLGETIQSLGVLALFPSLPVLLILLAQTLLQVVRMGFEERVLRESFPGDFEQYARRTRARWIPGVY
jgi:protein-S-isoprenylcysteine O-methyltransferase Ste14